MNVFFSFSGKPKEFNYIVRFSGKIEKGSLLDSCDLKTKIKFTSFGNKLFLVLSVVYYLYKSFKIFTK